MARRDDASAADRRTPRALLVDLDDTLFDHAHATRASLATLQARYPALAGEPLDALFQRHDAILEQLHTRVLTGALSIDEARRQRFGRLLARDGAAAAPGVVAEVAHAYRHAYEGHWRAVPGACDLLAATREAGLRVVVVTNNGVAEQRRKLEACDLAARIDVLVTSEEVGHAKPAGEIFAEALRVADAGPEDAVMLGDAWPTDIEGARAFGIRPVWFNRRGAESPDPAVQEIEALAPVAAALETLLMAPRIPA